MSIAFVRGTRAPLRRLVGAGLSLLVVAALVVGPGAPACFAQGRTSSKKEAAKNTSKKENNPAPSKIDPNEAQRRFEEDMAAPATKTQESEPAGPAAAQAPADLPNLFALWLHGGWIMYPLTFMSFLVVAFSAERFLGLRRGKVVPRGLTRGLGQLSARPGGLDPRQAYQLCQEYPSAAANVLRAVLLKVGRPISEIEHTMREASDREAGKLWKNVRPITLATALCPLLGLLGTVEGIIICFYKTSTMAAGADKSHELAQGIYEALVATFAGLVVAIPAAALAHYFEGRIQARFRLIDEMLLGLLPQLERFEGKLRLTRQIAETGEPTVRAVAPESLPKRQPAAPGKAPAS